MLAALIIVFREVIEAGIIVGIVMAATKTVPRRGRWIAGGIVAGIIGAALVAVFIGKISEAFAGIGQELFNACILSLAVVMLTWHNIWMSSHGRELAMEAKELGLLRPDDVVVFNAFELLHVAKGQALALSDRGCRPPLPARRVAVAGDVGIATFRMLLVNMLEGRFISPYDDEIATRIATVLCGGDIDRGTLVDEDWLLGLERRHFVELAQQPKTQERIAHMLKTGKPLRN